MRTLILCALVIALSSCISANTGGGGGGGAGRSWLQRWTSLTTEELNEFLDERISELPDDEQEPAQALKDRVNDILNEGEIAALGRRDLRELRGVLRDLRRLFQGNRGGRHSEDDDDDDSGSSNDDDDSSRRRGRTVRWLQRWLQMTTEEQNAYVDRHVAELPDADQQTARDLITGIVNTIDGSQELSEISRSDRRTIRAALRELRGLFRAARRGDGNNNRGQGNTLNRWSNMTPEERESMYDRMTSRLSVEDQAAARELKDEMDGILRDRSVDDLDNQERRQLRGLLRQLRQLSRGSRRSGGRPAGRGQGQNQEERQADRQARMEERLAQLDDNDRERAEDIINEIQTLLESGHRNLTDEQQDELTELRSDLREIMSQQ